MASSSSSAPIASAFNTMISSSSAAAALPAGSPCAACKFLRRKCLPECVFAPYFPPDQPKRFVNVHRVFGASNVTKLLNDLEPFQREDAVNSLAYEADMRLRDPVYGCVGVISILQHQLRQLQADLSRAKFELSQYQAAAAAAAAGGGGGDGGGSGGPANGGVMININHPIGLGGIGIGFGREQFYSAAARDQQQPQQQSSHVMMMKGYDSELLARLGANVGYDTGFVGAMNGSAAASMGPLGVPFRRPGSASGFERPAVGPN